MKRTMLSRPLTMVVASAAIMTFSMQTALAQSEPPLNAITSDGHNAPVPAAVLESTRPGGRAVIEARKLDQMNVDGTQDVTGKGAERADASVFGSPFRVIGLSLDRTSTTDRLTTDDYNNMFYLSVQRVDGTPDAVLMIGDDGSFYGLGSGGFSDSAIDRFAAITPDQLLAAGGPGGDLYLLSNDLKTVEPVNDEAVVVIGPKPISFNDFRTAKTSYDAKVATAEQEKLLSEYPDRIPDGLAGNAALVPPVSPLASAVPEIVIAAIGAVLIACSAYLIGARKHRTSGEANR